MGAQVEVNEVQTWTRENEGLWQRWSHPGLGLEAVANASLRVASILVIGTGPEDDEQLFATVRLARRVAIEPLKIVAGIVHPSARWLESVRQAGADAALLIPPPRSCPWPQPPLDDAVELGSGICPKLHVQCKQRVTLSVCGGHRDRMVLVRHHFDRWCLSAKEECPHWQGALRG